MNIQPQNVSMASLNVNATDPREQFVATTITQYELDLLLHHHEHEAMDFAFKSVALRQFSTCGARRAAYALQRLEVLDKKALVVFDAKIAKLSPEWKQFANEEICGEDNQGDRHSDLKHGQLDPDLVWGLDCPSTVDLFYEFIRYARINWPIHTKRGVNPVFAAFRTWLIEDALQRAHRTDPDGFTEWEDV